MAAGPGSTDAENGVKMAARDRFGDTANGAEPVPEPQLQPEQPPRCRASGCAASRGTGSLRRLGIWQRGGPRRLPGRRPRHRDQARAAAPAVPGGFTLDDFTIDERAGTVACPAGLNPPISPARTVTFGAACAGCPLRQRCTTAKDGRSMTIHPHEDLLRAARARPARQNSSRHTPPAQPSSGSSPGPPPRTGTGSGSATPAPPRTTPGCTAGAPWGAPSHGGRPRRSGLRKRRGLPPLSTCAPCSGTALPAATRPGSWPDHRWPAPAQTPPPRPRQPPWPQHAGSATMR